MSLTCAECKVKYCSKAPSERGELPLNCPMRNAGFHESCVEEYNKAETNAFYRNSVEAAIHAKDARFPRIMETVDFCRRNGFRHIGLASCIGSARDSAYCAKIFRREGFEVETVICTCGGINESELGIELNEKYWDAPDFAAACNPIGQARLLAEAGTEFNVVLGLCVGHDSLFLSHSKAPCTVLTIKDRVFPSNPVAGIYYTYGVIETEETKK